MTKEREISTSDLKTHCSEVIEEVSRRRKPIIITKRGKPVARFVPVDKGERETLFGFARGFVKIHGDILEPIDVQWEAQR
ncbi:MAG: type II toxin-antitoxin system Phd/YefM family antitoxin [Vicinamibacteria bacterium]